MGVQISNNKRTSVAGSTVVYKLADSEGNTVKLFEVPVEQSSGFQQTVTSEKSRLEKELGKTLSLVKVERVF